MMCGVITGHEKESDADSPVDALRGFYRAFNGADLKRMRKNWAPHDTVSMCNPLGGVKRGWPDIEQVYKRIFDGPAKVYVEFFDYSIDQSGSQFYAVGRERGWLRMGGDELALAIRTSRVFQRVAGEWRQVHHHGSVDDPALLAEYQQMVLSGR